MSWEVTGAMVMATAWGRRAVLGINAMVVMLAGPWAGVSVADERVRVRLEPVRVSSLATARLTVVAQAFPPSPCVVTIGFLDTGGRVITGRSTPTVATLDEPGDRASAEVGATASVLAPATPVVPFLDFPPNPCLGAELTAIVEVVVGGLATVTAVIDVGSLVGLNPQPEPPS